MHWASILLAVVLCVALVALPGCTYKVDGQTPSEIGIDFGEQKPLVTSNPVIDDNPDPNNNDYQDVPAVIRPWLPIGTGTSYSIDPREVYTMDSTLYGAMPNATTIARVVEVIITDHLLEGIDRSDLEPTIWDKYPNYFEQIYPDTCYMFVTFELTNLASTTNYHASSIFGGSTVFLVDGANRIRWNWVWYDYPVYESIHDTYNGTDTVILMPNQPREITLGYLIDKKRWFTEIDKSEGWHFFLGFRDALRAQGGGFITGSPVIPFYGWRIDDDRIIYQDFE